uniref:Uncharacterized protein n=1 Tax=Physcomitrium patens TaxID=3218 RepID=A0A2K1KB87_PHYPA|nr:hypothetical protein PHYPA_010214 [Physcomitrium patens]PNR51036.1 hypothetical protein PHYPA_010222 [Physcomitrium patens]PNR51040.1 hypothetical protein PHYPA_010226 [Physcomitrium patens]
MAFAAWKWNEPKEVRIERTGEWGNSREGKIEKGGAGHENESAEGEEKQWAAESSTAGFEPARGNPSRFRVCRLNHSAKLTRATIYNSGDPRPCWGSNPESLAP